MYVAKSFLLFVIVAEINVEFNSVLSRLVKNFLLIRVNLYMGILKPVWQLVCILSPVIGPYNAPISGTYIYQPELET